MGFISDTAGAGNPVPSGTLFDCLCGKWKAELWIRSIRCDWDVLFNARALHCTADHPVKSGEDFAENVFQKNHSYAQTIDGDSCGRFVLYGCTDVCAVLRHAERVCVVYDAAWVPCYAALCRNRGGNRMARLFAT